MKLVEIIDYTGKQKNIHWQLEHCPVREKCLKFEIHI